MIIISILFSIAAFVENKYSSLLPSEGSDTCVNSVLLLFTVRVASKPLIVVNSIVYFSSKYKSVSKANLYDKFKQLIKKTDYKSFLKELEQNAHMYRKIVAPQRQDYKNKKQYYWLVQSLDAFNKVFNIF